MKTIAKGKRRGFHFRATDAGRKQSKHPRSKNDCVIRAVATVSGASFDKVYDEVTNYSRHMDLHDWALSDRPLNSLGIRLKWHPLGCSDEPLPVRFCGGFRCGRWILSTGRFTYWHVFAVVDGVIFDEHPPPPICPIYGAYSCAGKPMVKASRRSTQLISFAAWPMPIEEQQEDEDDDDDDDNYEERLEAWVR